MWTLAATIAMAPWDRLKQPDPGGRMLVGIVRTVDVRARKINISIDYELNSEGIEHGYGVPREASWKVSDDSWLAPLENEELPLGLGDLRSGDMVAAFMGSRPAPGPAEYWLVHPRWRPNQLEPAERDGPKPPEPDKVSMEKVVLPMRFPVASQVRWSDTFLVARDGGSRRHLGQDLMGKKMMPLVAVFDGTVTLKPGGPGGHYYLSVTRSDGWRCAYLHVNNDTPGTDDGLGGTEYAYAPGISNGSKVVAGEFIAWMGDSGNAESTGPHCHFELWSPEGAVVNAAPSLRNASPSSNAYVRQYYADLKLAPGEMRLDGKIESVDLVAKEFTVLGLIKKDGGWLPLRQKYSLPLGDVIRHSSVNRQVAVVYNEGGLVRTSSAQTD